MMLLVTKMTVSSICSEVDANDSQVRVIGFGTDFNYTKNRE